MRTRRPIIPQRKPIFIGCEGESEQAYAGRLQDLIAQQGLHVHLNIEVLRAGDPLARLEFAVRKLEHLKKTRGTFADKFVLLDTDQLLLSPARAVQARAFAQANDIRIVWQDPCFEAMLLRHLPGRAARRPPNNQATQTALLQDWPAYRKPMSRGELATVLDLDSVVRAAGVEHDLGVLLQCIGLIPANP
jgi:hypothetical protein